VDEADDKSLLALNLDDPEKMVQDFWVTINNTSKVNTNILTDDDVSIVRSEGKAFVSIVVPRADRHDKPVYVGPDPFKGTFKRNGEGDYHCTAPEVRAMYRDQADVSADTRVIEGMTASDLQQKLQGKLQGNLSEKAQAVLTVIANNPYATANEIAALVGATSDAVSKRLQSLKEKGHIVRIGPDKGGHWEIV
jgi:predicted HTH transcriptional regulator